MVLCVPQGNAALQRYLGSISRRSPSHAVLSNEPERATETGWHRANRTARKDKIARSSKLLMKIAVFFVRILNTAT
jgi:hypothetical protein